MKKGILITLVAIVALLGAAEAYVHFKLGIDLWDILGGKTQKHLRLVPKNAIAVGTVDLISLAKKADVSKVKELTWFKEMQKQTETMSKSDSNTDRVMKMLKDPASIGINVNSDVYGFAVKNGENGIAGGFVFAVKNADNLENSVKKASQKAEIVSGANYKAVIKGDIALAWNDVGGIVAVTSSYDKDKMKSFLDETFKRSVSESILGNNQFKKFNSARKDASLFLNGNELITAMSSLSDNPYAGMMMGSVSTSFKDRYFWTNLDFQDDKISLTSHVEIEGADNLAGIVKSSGLSEDHLNTITDKNVYAMTTVNMDGDKFFAYVESLAGVKSNMDQAATMIGMSTKDMESMFGGELSAALVSFRDRAHKEEEETKKEGDDEMDDYYSYKSPMTKAMEAAPIPVFTFNFSSKNKDGVKKLLEGKVEKGPDGYYHFPVSDDFYVDLAENKFGFTVTDDDDLAKTIASTGKLGSLPQPAADLAKNNGSSVFMDLTVDNYPQNVRTALQTGMSDQGYDAFATYMKLFKNVTATGSGHDSELSLNLSSGTGNSLYRMLAQADEVYKKVKGSAAL